jgi:hypothetical protein
MKTDRDKALDDRDRMFRRWRAWHAEELETVAAGPWHVELSGLLDFLVNMDLNSGDALIELVKHQGWHGAGAGVRYLILREIDLAIARVREENNLPPFDDALPWGSEAPTVFSVIKEFLIGDDEPAAASSSDQTAA